MCVLKGVRLAFNSTRLMHTLRGLVKIKLNLCFPVSPFQMSVMLDSLFPKYAPLKIQDNVTKEIQQRRRVNKNQSNFLPRLKEWLSTSADVMVIGHLSASTSTITLWRSTAILFSLFHREVDHYKLSFCVNLPLAPTLFARS